MKKQENTPIVNKIEIDEKTAEPHIVRVSKKQLSIAEKRKRADEKYDKHDFVSRKADKSVGKQMAMDRVFGTDKITETTNKRQKILKLVVTLVFVAFVVGVLFATAYDDFFGGDPNRKPLSWEEVSALLSSSWLYLLLALFSLFCCFFFKAIKLSTMCKSLTGNFHFKTCFETGIIGHYYNNVTPLAVGGQPFEIYHLSKHGVHGGVATSLPLVTFFLNQLAFVVLGVVSLCLIGFSPFTHILPATFNVMATIGLVSCILVPAIIILFSLLPRLGAKIVHFVMTFGAKIKVVKEPKKAIYKTMKTVAHNSKCIKRFASRPFGFNLSFLFSFFEQLSAASIAFFTLKLFGFNYGETTSIFMQWVITCQIYFILNAAIAFIPTPGNSGAADLSFFLLFESGLAVGLAFPAMLTWRLLAFYSYIIIGFIFATLKKKADRKREALQNSAE